MAVYYKFKSVKDYDSIPIDGHFISVLNLKEKIFVKKHLGRGTDFDLVVTNAQTKEDYLDEAMLVPKNTSIIIRRVPGCRRMPIVAQPLNHQNELIVATSKPDDAQQTNSNFVGAGSSIMKYPDDSEWDEFGNDFYAIPEALPVQTSNRIQYVPPTSKAHEDNKIKALIDTPALDWQHQTDGVGPGRGFVRGMGGRMMGGRGFGRSGFERRTPPPGYVCFRCNQPGHLIQHCPTNGIPEFDVKQVRPPTGIPKSMLTATSDGSYALPNGAVAVLKPNEAAFDKEIEGLPSTRSVGDLPPEFYCPLCKEVMKDAVLTGKCCFTSFCDKCIRARIITKSICVCGANNVLADDLLPNKTLRDSVNRILESNNSSTENGGSVFQIQDMESKMEHPRIEQKVPSPTHSAASKGNQAPTPQIEEPSKVKNAVACQNTMEEGRTRKVPDVSEATSDSVSVKEHASQGNAPLADNEVQQKPLSDDAGKKKKKKKIRVPSNETQWENPQDVVMENFMMHMGPSAYNAPYWNGMQHGMEGFLPPFGGLVPHFMGNGPGPLDFPFGLLPQNPYGFPNMTMPPPFPPQRDLAELGMRRGVSMNGGPPTLSREEFEARKADLRRKREIERRGERKDLSRDGEFSREMSNGDVSSLKPKSKPLPLPCDDSRQRHHQRRPSSSPKHLCRPSDRPSTDSNLPRPSSKRKSSDQHELDYDHRHRKDSHHHRSEPSFRSAASEAPSQEKSTVFSRISFSTKEEAVKKMKSCSSEHRSNGYCDDQKKGTVKGVKRVSVQESSEDEDDRHFKRRRPVRYEEEIERGSRYERGQCKRRYS